MRPIDADKLTPRCMFRGRCDSGGGLRCDRCTDYSVEYQDIKNAPTVSPERKTGHWIPVINGRGGHQCDRCGSYAPSYQSGTEWLSNFCPECNADMRGKQE